MKHVLRIVVTLLVLAGLGLGVYFIWFAPDADLSTFIALNDLNEYERQINIEGAFADLQVADGHGTVYVREKTTYTGELNKDKVEENIVVYKNAFPFDYDNAELEDFGLGTNPFVAVMNKVNYEDILTNRALVLDGRNAELGKHNQIDLNSSFRLETDDAKIQYSFASYSVLEKYLDEIYLSYLAYTQVATDVTGAAQDAINDKVEAYKKALLELKESIDITLDYQNVYNYNKGTPEELLAKTVEKDGKVIEYYITNFTGDNNAIHVELDNRYSNIVKKYRTMLYCYTQLIQEVENFVTKFVFDGEIINEVSTIKNEMLLLSIKNAVAGEYNTNDEKDKANIMMADTNVFVNSISGDDFEVDAQELLDVYNRIYAKYYEGLEKVMAYTPIEKSKFIGGYDKQSDIISTYAKDLADLLKLYGYTGIAVVQ